MVFFVSYNYWFKYVVGLIGILVDLVEMKIVDIEIGEMVLFGEFGEIVIKGLNVMFGYWN